VPKKSKIRPIKEKKLEEHRRRQPKGGIDAQIGPGKSSDFAGLMKKEG
jgi:hypothetical protein